MIDPNYKISVKEISADSSQITIEPLPYNFGHTLGNALRRVLLTSLEGGAATSVKIDGVPHQFSTLAGVKEDILEFILSLKTVNFGVEDDEVKTVKLHATGTKEITAADLELPTGVSVSNPEKVLVHLTNAKAKFNAIITVARGMGYVPADENASDEIGVIPLDASYSPVVAASYVVEATRVGRSTNFDKVKLNVTTNGTISPIDAFKQAATILSGYFGYINSESAYTVEAKSKSSIESAGYVDDLDLPTRILNALKKSGIVKLNDLKSMSLSDLQKVKNLGEKSAKEVVEKAKDKGIIIA